MATTDDHWARLATAIKARRLELGLTQSDAAGAAGCSLTTWNGLETASRQVSERTRALIAVALGWPANALDRILAGDDPASFTRVGADPLPAWQAELVESMQTLSRALGTFTEIVDELRDEVRSLRVQTAPDPGGPHGSN